MTVFLHQVALAAPLFSLVFVGYALMRLTRWPTSISHGLTRFVFSVALPATLFRLLCDFSKLPPVDARLLLAFFGGCLIVFCIGRLIAWKVFALDGVAQSVFALGGVFSNNLMLGLPLAKVALGPEMVSYVKKSFTASLEAGASILMIYITVLLTIRHFSIDELGDFQVVVRPIFTYMTTLFVFPIYRFVLPELAVNLRSGDHRQIRLIRRWIFRLSAIVSLVFFLVMLLAGKPLVLLLFPVDYVGAVPVLFHFSIFFIFMMLNGYQLAYIKAHGHFTQSLLIRAVGIVALVAAYYLVARFTTNVVAIIVALGLGYLVMFVLSTLAEQRILRALPPMLASNG